MDAQGKFGSIVDAVSRRFGWAGPLLARVALGLVFVGTGWGKLNDLQSVTEFFTELGIPAPGIQAVVVSSLEFGCGILLVLGLAARLAAVPLVAIMTVAIATARLSDVGGVLDLAGLTEFTYLTVFVWIALAGPGPASLDHVIARRFAQGAPLKLAGSPDPARA